MKFNKIIFRTLLLFCFFFYKSAISQINFPSVLRFNTVSMAIDGQELPSIEWCETFYFDKITSNLIYSKTCDDKLYKIMITKVNSITDDPNDWHRDYSGYDPDRPVYNNGQLVPNKQIILAYYFGKYSFLYVSITYNASGQILKSTAMKYSNAEKPIQ